MTGTWIAVLLSVLSALCYSGGAVTQRRLARDLDTRAARPSAQRRSGAPAAVRTLLALLEHRLWWASIGLNSVGALLHVAALFYGTLIVVQPLGTLTLVFALPWAALSATRRVTPREWHGAALTVVGLAIMLLTAESSGGAARPDGAATLSLLLHTVAVLTALVVAGRRLRPPWHGLLPAVAAGTAFGAASALTKTLATQLTAVGSVRVLSVGVLGLAVLVVAGMLLSQAAYRRMDVGAPLATMILANPVAAVCAGVVFMGERYTAGQWGIGVGVLAGILAARGVLLLVRPAPVGARTPSATGPGPGSEAGTRGAVMAGAGARPGAGGSRDDS